MPDFGWRLQADFGERAEPLTKTAASVECRISNVECPRKKGQATREAEWWRREYLVKCAAAGEDTLPFARPATRSRVRRRRRACRAKRMPCAPTRSALPS